MSSALSSLYPLPIANDFYAIVSIAIIPQLGCMIAEFFSNFSVILFLFFFSLSIHSWCREFFEKVQSSIRDLAEEKDKSVGASTLFLRAMRYPFFRVGAYANYLAQIAQVLTVSG